MSHDHHMICHVTYHMIYQDHRGSDRLLESSDKHKVVLSVEKEQPLGFSVRGGREFSLGIFVSQ